MMDAIHHWAEHVGRTGARDTTLEFFLVGLAEAAKESEGYGEKILVLGVIGLLAVETEKQWETPERMAKRTWAAFREVIATTAFALWAANPALANATESFWTFEVSRDPTWDGTLPTPEEILC